MMNDPGGMMDGMGGMMWSLWISWTVIVFLVVLGIAALVKYLFYTPRRSQNGG